MYLGPRLNDSLALIAIIEMPAVLGPLHCSFVLGGLFDVVSGEQLLEIVDALLSHDGCV